MDARPRHAVLKKILEKRDTTMKITTFPSLLIGAFSLLLAHTVLAGPTDPVSVETPPSDQGAAQIPGSRLLEDLPLDYVEEEYFISGSSTLFNYAHNPPWDPTI